MSQNKAILALLKRGVRLTPLAALRRCGTFRLASRIYDLERAGHSIDHVPVKINGKRVMSYSLAKRWSI